MKTLALSLVLLTGCATTSRWHCEEIYCQPPPCAIEDKSLIADCTQQHLERKRSVLDWFGSVLVGAGHFVAAVF